MSEPPVWHPFTPMTAHRREGVPVITDARGFTLIDAEGREYLDGISSLWCNLHGHRVPEIDAAVRTQLDRVAHSTLLGLECGPANELARRLVEITPPGLDRVFFSDSGSTAIEAALKICWQYHRQKPDPEPGRDLFVTVDNAYHGDTVGSVSVGSIKVFHDTFGPLLFNTRAVKSPAWTPHHGDRAAHRSAAFADLERTFREVGDRMAAFVVEPLVQGAAGILVHPPGYLRRVRAMSDEYGVPLVADEVAVGFCRTGSLFACEQEEVVPDLLCLAKGLTGGYLPLAATLASQRIYEAFLGEPHEGRTFFHGHTFTGNALGCAAALASLDLLERDDSVGRAVDVGDRLRDRLTPLSDRPHVAQVRRKGTMVGIELVADREPLTPYPAERRTGHRVTRAARERGVVVRPLGDTVVLMPAPMMPPADVDRLVAVTIESIDEATR